MTDEAAAREAPEDEPPAPGRPRPARGSRKVLAGVCAGAGRYFDVDPVIFRVVLVVLSLTGGIGLIIYGTCWLIVPLEGETESEAHRLLSGRIEGAPLTAVLMALVGCGLYASMIGNGANQAFSMLLLTATAGAVYWSQQRRNLPEAVSPDVASAVADAPPAVQAPPEPGGSASWWREPLTKEPPYLWGPDEGPYGEADRAAWRQRKKASRRENSSWQFGLTVFLLVVAAASAGTGLSWQYQPVGTSLEIGLAAALGVFGCAFVVASFAGRARGGTVFFSLLTVAALVTAAALPKSGHGLGSTTWRPVTAAAVPGTYERGAGTGVLDLTRLSLDGATVTTRVSLGAGQAVVRLPKSAVVVLSYDLGLGEIVLPGKVNDGVSLKTGRHEVLRFAPPNGATSTGTLVLDVSVGLGQLKVVR